MTDFPRITVDPDVMGGRPCIRGMRVTVGAILGLGGVNGVKRSSGLRPRAVGPASDGPTIATARPPGRRLCRVKVSFILAWRPPA